MDDSRSTTSDDKSTLPFPDEEVTMNVDRTVDDLSQLSPSRYRERMLLGKGGMGEVRLCRDEHIGRDVALKIVPPDHATDPRAVARFLKEARLQGRLEHPSIVPVHDIGRGADGSPYFTMKRVRGRTLSDV